MSLSLICGFVWAAGSRLNAETDLPAQCVLALWDDVAQAGRVEVLVKDIAVRLGRVDVLLNTVSGRSGGRPVAEIPEDEN